MSHIYHPLILDAGFCDECPRCHEMAENPIATLDVRNTLALYLRTTLWMKDEEFPRSDLELKAMRQMERLIIGVKILREKGIEL